MGTKRTNAKATPSQIDVRNRRRHERYDVSFLDELSGQTEFGPNGERLVTFSMGGCGFCAPDGDFRFNLLDKVICTFQLEGMNQMIRVRGEILYVFPFPFQGQVGKFYGIRFLKQDESKVKPITDRLKVLAKDGKVTRA